MMILIKPFIQSPQFLITSSTGALQLEFKESIYDFLCMSSDDYDQTC